MVQRIQLQIEERGARPATASIREIGRQAAASQQQVSNLRGTLGGLNNSVNRTNSNVVDFSRVLQSNNRHLINTSTTAQQVERNFKGINRSLSKTFSLSSTLGAAFSGLTVALGGAAIIRTADNYNLLNDRLKLVTDSEAQLTRVNEELFASAQRNRSSLSNTVDLYTRLARSTREANVSEQDLLQVTQTINQAIRVSGVSAQAANAALVQFSQGLASGALRGDELRSVLEQTPRLAEALATGLGTTIGQLRELGSQGQLTTQRIISALLDQSSTVQSEFDGINVTVGDALTQVNNAFINFVGQLNRATGFTSALASGLTLLSQNIQVAVVGATALGVALAAAFAPVFQRSLLALATNIGIVTAQLATATLGAQVFATTLLTTLANPVFLGIAGIAAGLGLVIATLNGAFEQEKRNVSESREQQIQYNRAISDARLEVQAFARESITLNSDVASGLRDVSNSAVQLQNAYNAFRDQNFTDEQARGLIAVNQLIEQQRALVARNQRAANQETRDTGIIQRRALADSERRLNTLIELQRTLRREALASAEEQLKIEQQRTRAQLREQARLLAEFERASLGRLVAEENAALRTRDARIAAGLDAVQAEFVYVATVFDLNEQLLRDLQTIEERRAAIRQRRIDAENREAQNAANRRIAFETQLASTVAESASTFEAQLEQRIESLRQAGIEENRLTLFAEQQKREFYRDTTTTFREQIIQQTRALIESNTAAQQAFDSVINNTTNSITDAITQGRFDFASLANAIITDLVRIQVRALILRAVLAGVSGFNSPSTGPDAIIVPTTNAIPSPSVTAAGGGSFYAADGGVFSGPTSGFTGTLHGTEAVVPLPDGRNIPVDLQQPTNNRMGNVQVNVINNSKNAQVSSANVDQVSGFLNIVIDDINNDGPLGQSINASVQRNLDGNGPLRRAVRRNL